MKIGLVFDDSLDRNDGVQQYVKAIGAYYTRQGHDVRYLVGETVIKEWEGGSVHSMSRNLKVSFNRNRLSTPWPANKKAISKLLEEADFDILHVQIPYSPVMAGRVIAAAPPKTAIVGTFHIIGADWKTNAGNHVLGKFLKRQLGKFDALWSVSVGAQHFSKRFYGIDTEVMPNVVDIKKFRNAKPTYNDPETKKIVFLGRHVERKGVRELVAAMHKLVHNHQADHVHLYLGGDGPLRPELEQVVRDNNLKDYVTFLGFLDEADKPGLLASADIAVFPSLYGESFGIVLLEGMAAGSGVVIGGDNPGYASVLGDWTETLFKPSDIDLFAKQLHWLLADDEMRHNLHKKQQAAIGQYDIEVVGQKLLKTYEKVIEKKQRTV